MGMLRGERADGQTHKVRFTKRTKKVSDFEMLVRLSLEGIEAAEACEELWLHYESPLRDLDVAPLSSLPHLHTITMGVDELPDFSRYTGGSLHKLDLHIHGEGPLRLASLAACTSLETLSIHSAATDVDLTGIEGLSLESFSLTASATKVDFSRLQGLQLETLGLHLPHCKTVPWDVLASFRGLTDLGIGLPVDHRPALAAFPELRNLRLSGGDLQDLDFSPLSCGRLYGVTIRGSDTLTSLDLNAFANEHLSHAIVHGKAIERVRIERFRRAVNLRNLDLSKTGLKSFGLGPLIPATRLNALKLPPDCELQVPQEFWDLPESKQSTGLRNATFEAGVFP